MQLKESKYNFFYPFEQEPGKMIAYNARTNALALMEADKWQKYQLFVDEGVAFADDELRAKLLQGGFVLNETIDEDDYIRLRMYRGKFANSQLSLTIAPTIDCNFACVYCYQKQSRKNLDMSQAVQDKIVEFVQRKASTVKEMRVSWYGGEPLVSRQTVENLSKRIIAVCQENGIRYRASIVTNGYLLDTAAAQMLNENFVENVQITVDGIPAIHDIRRPLVGLQGTFDKIIQNIIDNTSKFSSVMVRVNIDKSNMDSFSELLVLLKEKGVHLLKNVSIYVAQCRNTNEGYCDSECLMNNDFFAFRQRAYELMREQGFYVTARKGLDFEYPQTVSFGCGANQINNYVIDPAGDMYLCWDDIGMVENRIGSILSNSTSVDNPILFNYLLYNPLEDDLCKNCKVLPICMGYCSRRRMEGNDRCVEHKYNLEANLRNAVVQTLARKGNV